VHARRAIVTLGASVLMVGSLAACEPVPPPPVYTVTETTWASDAAPGDGVCEATEGAGDCTLQAAVEEANATVGGADVVVPYTGDTYPGVFIAITGQVRISGGMPGVLADPSSLTVAAGGSLSLADIDLQAVAEVDGALGAVRSSFVGTDGPAVTVGATGSVILNNVLLTASSAEVVRNGGLFGAIFTTVQPGSAGAVVTDATGETVLGATAVLGDGSGPAACGGAGTVSSLGYNAVDDSSCGLAGTGDVVVAETELLPSFGSLRLEAIPSGEAGCGTTVLIDIRGDVRPMDFDQDFEARCDIGAWEANPNIAT
jgi:hypothetical protein